MLTFAPGMQLLALVGLAAAAAPVVIHLFNRRRFREIEWAAMEFLLEAASRSRSLLHLRDLLLLLLRTAAVACFALAVARPFFTTRPGAAAGAGPVHAILVVDNSLSMGRMRLDGRTLLDDARERAKAFVGQLPAGSRTSVLPLCGPAGSFTFDAHRTQADAVDAIDAIRLVDRGGTAAQALELAGQAAALAPDMPDVRTIFIGDQQAAAWPVGTPLPGTDGGTADMQVVAVVPEHTDNTWVESLTVEDGSAAVDLPVRLVAVVRHAGSEPRTGVQVRLVIDGADVATETIDLEAGQAREIAFSTLLDASPEPGRPDFVAATVVLPADAVPADDRRSVSIPVLASLPVVFVDECGAAGEDPRRGRYGETRGLRMLLAPTLDRGGQDRQLVDVRHVTIDGLDDDVLDDVRLVVVAGVRSPAGAVERLRQFVADGGRLVVAAGGDFDPQAWTSEAWLDGEGILPVPLGAATGTLPDEPGTLEPVFLDWKSMQDDALFRLPDVADEELADLYAEPLFFRVVAADTAAGAEVRAAFTDGRPFIVTRPVDDGEVVFVSSGLFGPWNTLSKTNAMLLFDRLLRGLIAATLPPATFETADQIVVPVAAGDRTATLSVERPDATSETLSIEALGGDAVGVAVRDATRRGVYTVSATAADDGLALWKRPLAVNPPVGESPPDVLDAGSFAARTGADSGLRWVAPGEPIGVDGARVSGQGIWWWLLAASGACLAAEQVVLAWQHRSTATPAPAEAAA